MARGHTSGVAVIGRWRSKAGDVLYPAIGAVCDSEGNPVAELPAQ